MRHGLLPGVKIILNVLKERYDRKVLKYMHARAVIETFSSMQKRITQ